MEKLRQKFLNETRKIVLKIGSRILVDLENQALNEPFIHHLAQDIAQLRAIGKEVTVVSSGAVGAGMLLLGLKQKPDRLADKQACAAIGQIRLMEIYRHIFSQYGLVTAQILLSADDFRDRARFRNITQTFQSLQNFKAVPIINENDTVAVQEIKVGDNDKLSADVTHFLNADLLVIFTDADGLYTKNPKKYSDAQLISVIPKITKEVEQLAETEPGSSVSTGGMPAKLRAIKEAVHAGRHVFLASGFNTRLSQLFSSESHGTWFVAETLKKSSKNRWLSYISHPKGTLYADAGTVKALLEKNSSLLAVGLTRVEGKFHRGDLVAVVCANTGETIARGLAGFASDEVQKVLGKPSRKVQELLGTTRSCEMIHKNNLVLV
jgi:glutamate 5-kinase